MVGIDTNQNYADEDQQYDLLSSRLNDDELVRSILEKIEWAKSHFSEWREQANKCYDFYSGKQWDDEDIEKLSSERRPSIVFNRIPRTINALAGLEIENRREIQYIPRQANEQNDTQFASLMNQAEGWVSEESDIPSEDSESFKDMLICGYGWSETVLDYEEVADGQIRVNRIDPLEMLYDIASKKKDLSDTRWRSRVITMSRAEVKERWKNFDGGSGDIFEGPQMEHPHMAGDPHPYKPDQSANDDFVRHPVDVIHYEYYVREPFYRVLMKNNEIKELDEKTYNKAKEVIENAGLRAIKQYRRRYKHVFIAGNQLLEKPTDNAVNDFMFQPMTGFRNKNSHTYFGYVTLMMDPQKWANKWLSQILNIVNTSASSGLFVEEGALDDETEAEETFNTPGGITHLTEGGLQRIREKITPNMPSAMHELLQYALVSMNEVTGVNSEMLGATSNVQADVLENTRKRTGLTVAAPFFDSLKQYQKRTGIIRGKMIRDYIADGRLIRIVSNAQAQFIPLIRDNLALEYDVIITDSTTSPLMKDSTFRVLMQLMPQFLQAGLPVPADLLDYTPLPENLVMAWKQQIQQNQQQQMQQQQMAQQQAMQQQQHQMEIDNIDMMLKHIKGQQEMVYTRKIASDVTLNEAKAMAEVSSGKHDQALAQKDLESKSNEIERENQAFIAEQNRKNLEVMLNQRRKFLESEISKSVQY